MRSVQLLPVMLCGPVDRLEASELKLAASHHWLHGLGKSSLSAVIASAHDIFLISFLVQCGVRPSEPKDSTSATVLVGEHWLLTMSFCKTQPLPGPSCQIAQRLLEMLCQQCWVNCSPAGWWDGKVSSAPALGCPPAPAQPASPPDWMEGPGEILLLLRHFGMYFSSWVSHWSQKVI